MHVRKEVYKLRELPPLSEVAQEIFDAVNDEEIALEDLAEVIERSPEISARLIGLANSAYFGRSGDVHCVTDAIIRVLGLNTVKSIALAYTLSGCFDLRTCPHFNAYEYWQHCILTGTLAQRACQKSRLPERPRPQDAYTAGLTCGLGQLALVHLFPREMSDIYLMLTRSSSRDINELCQEQLGTNPGEAGHWLAQHWGLPELLGSVLSHHHVATYRDEFWPAVTLVGVTKDLAHQIILRQPLDAVSDVRFAALGLTQNDQEKLVETADEGREGLEQTAALLADG